MLKEGHKAMTLDKFAQGAVRAENDIKPPKLIKEVAPVYPEVARVAVIEGVVILGVKTDEAGKVKDVIVLRSIPLLDQAAIDAVRQWVYEPMIIDGKAVPVVFTVTVRFQLK
jgi:protein TonB